MPYYPTGVDKVRFVGEPVAVVVATDRYTAEDAAAADDGVGLPPGFRPVLAGLGTRIVTSLVQDLQGRIRWENSSPHGTRVVFVARLRPLER